MTVTVLVVFPLGLAALFVWLVLVVWLVLIALLLLTGLSGLLPRLTALLALSELPTLLAFLLHIVCHENLQSKARAAPRLENLINSFNLVASEDGEGWVNTVFYRSPATNAKLIRTSLHSSLVRDDFRVAFPTRNAIPCEKGHLLRIGALPAGAYITTTTATLTPG